ncbi:MAG TPA: hypothetical protein VK849_02435 [Longimicrobiales bacterium]|nr:hypothetical protein [Longimicrobiales bacterium]
MKRTIHEPRVRDPGDRAWRVGGEDYVSAAFEDLDDALDATCELEERAYGRERISVVMATDTRELYIDTHPRYGEIENRAVTVEDVDLEKRRRTAEGVGAGGAIGGALGAAGAAALAVGTTLVVPPLGIAVAGPVAAALAGLGAGAATGGVVGALAGAGMTEYRARRFEELVKEGRVLVGVAVETAPERADVAEVFEKHGGDVISPAA